MCSAEEVRIEPLVCSRVVGRSLENIERDEISCADLRRCENERVEQCKILVVEDDDDIRDSLKELLEEEGYDIDTAANGLQALARMQGPTLPHVILLDLMMPVMDGWQFQQELRQVPAYSEIPVIVISAGKVFREPLNAKAFIPKPLDAGVLLETVESLLLLTKP